jgi:hypothetical protein
LLLSNWSTNFAEIYCTFKLSIRIWWHVHTRGLTFQPSLKSTSSVFDNDSANTVHAIYAIFERTTEVFLHLHCENIFTVCVLHMALSPITVSITWNVSDAVFLQQNHISYLTVMTTLPERYHSVMAAKFATGTQKIAKLWQLMIISCTTWSKQWVKKCLDTGLFIKHTTPSICSSGNHEQKWITQMYNPY